jgi:hypothetical protein
MPGGVKTGTLLGKPDEPPPTAPPPVVRASVPRRPPVQQTVKPETAEQPKYIVDSIRGGKRTQEPLGEPGKQESAKGPVKEGDK